MPLTYSGGLVSASWRDASGEVGSSQLTMVDVSSSLDITAHFASAAAFQNACEAFHYAGTPRVKLNVNDVETFATSATRPTNGAQRELSLWVKLADTDGNTQTFTIPMLDPSLVGHPAPSDFVDTTQPIFDALRAAIQDPNMQSRYGFAFTDIMEAKVVGRNT